jgi:hypothetical protein
MARVIKIRNVQTLYTSYYIIALLKLAKPSLWGEKAAPAQITGSLKIS